ncbi:thiamine phosphate synthase [Candidatus Marinamargulisbacteria bacterium SCGC AG-439-L15]|nr:thiamine phosphate synthase [Candidatus Marinamargulisbacteria bacterium SCGC AG-439-L15]
MKESIPQIIDANINRASEGLRVIEDYCRFISHQKEITEKLASLRKKINMTETESDKIRHLNARNTENDMRAKEAPPSRPDKISILKANFKRVEEALRVLEEYTENPNYNEARYDVYELEKEVLLTVIKPCIKPGIYLISHDVDILKKGLEWGVSLIQLRDKEADKPSLYEKAKALIIESKKKEIPLIINDFLDIALSVDADGVHTGQDDIPISEQRNILGAHKLIGRTTHSLDQGLLAEKDGADYVSVGPIWETPSKPNRDGIGFDYLEKAKKEISIPYVAIGGINHNTIDQIYPHTPPLIGLIRDYEHIPEFLKHLTQK